MYDETCDVPLAEMEHVDYTDEYNQTYGCNALAVHAAGKEMLVIWDQSKKCGKKNVPMLGIESYSLSCRARPESDDFCAVEWGPDGDVWTGADARALLTSIERGESAFKTVSLF